MSSQVDPGAAEGGGEGGGKGGDKGGWITRLVYPEDYTIDEGGRTIACRTQMPLKLAWASALISQRIAPLPPLAADPLLATGPTTCGDRSDGGARRIASPLAMLCVAISRCYPQSRSTSRRE